MNKTYILPSDTLKQNLQEFYDAIDKVIDKEYEKLVSCTNPSVEETVRINSRCHALDQCKYAIFNILDGRRYYDNQL